MQNESGEKSINSDDSNSPMFRKNIVLKNGPSNSLLLPELKLANIAKQFFNDRVSEAKLRTKSNSELRPTSLAEKPAK